MEWHSNVEQEREEYISPGNVQQFRKHKSNYSMGSIPSMAGNMMSNTLGFSDVELSPKRRKKMKKLRMSDFNSLSITINPDELSGLLDTTMSTMMTTIVNYSSDNLFLQFQTIFQTQGDTQQVFDVISNFIEVCTTTIESISSGRGFTDQQGNDISWLVQERNTWRLLFALYKNRTTYQDEFNENVNMGFNSPLSEKDIILNYYQNNSSIREAQLVIDWLERNARDEWELLDRDDIAHYTDMTVAWENTLYQLQTSNIAYKSTREIVSSLDPDAPLRENKPLHDLDMDDEKRLLKQVFFEIRRGQLDKAQKLCIHCGQAWRASTLDGWRLFHDPNYLKQDNNEKLPVEGNPLRDIWKLCAWRMCEDPRVSEDDKAIMGSLCGHLDSVLPHCTSWEDKLWAYTRTAVDILVEREIRDNSFKDYIDMPVQYWGYLKTMEGILKEIGNTGEGSRPDRIIQEMIILGSPGELLVKCSKWLEEQCQPQFLRFITHLVLILRLLGYSTPENLGDNVIKAYVNALIPEGNVDSIAYYCSLLPEEDQIEQYAQFMETVTDYGERQECLTAAEKYEMNVPIITEKVVKSIRSRKQDVELSESLAHEATQEDMNKISALDWMIFYPQQRAEALWECNALIREFIALKKLSTARKAFNKIPEGSPELIMEQYRCEVDDQGRVTRHNLPPKVDSSLKEYLCYKAYLDAQEGFIHWFEQFHNSKPNPPVSQVRKNFSETVAYEHKLKRYHEDLAIWNDRMAHETKIVKAQLYNVLLFPDGGWLVDTLLDDEPRKSHLQCLRKLCIPQVFMLLYKVLDSMGLHDEVMDIVSLIIDESHQHYKSFSKENLDEFIKKLVGTSISLIQFGKDPFGEKVEKSDISALPILTSGTACKERVLQGNTFLKEYVGKINKEEKDRWEPPEDADMMENEDEKKLSQEASELTEDESSDQSEFESFE
ncbi:nuclear pore complex protein Nup107 [Cimex lectularius]|uniref:Nuclear pore complex protein n=1 Tax=Cimex lectularius TaxID=79782 RepID=A0A8I6RIK1_CIMLE|nr:nuclear pore complex protein Nup107 [Cimex lectularius]